MVIEELYTRLGFQVDPQGIEKGKQLLSSFKTWVGGLAIGAGFTLLAKTGLDAAMTMETLNAQFKVMTGSAERSAELLADISDFAAKTPFSKLGLADAGKTLMAFGLEAEKVVPTLRMLGDVAGADQTKLKGLALVFGQIQSTGRLMGQDLLQLINQGFNPLTEISKKTGISVAKLKDAMAQGAITADMVTAAFQSATSEGGLFYKNLEAQSQTLQGRISTLKDNFVTALQNMAEAFMPLLKTAAEFAIAFDWTPIVSSVQAFGAAISDLPALFNTIMTWARRLAPVLLVIFGPAIQAYVLRYVNAIRSAIAASSAFAGVQTIVQRAALASGAAMNYQVTSLGLLKSAMFSLRTTAVSSFKAIGLAMNTALGPIGIALMAIEGFVEAYNWLEGRSRTKATEEQKQWARKFLDQGTAQGKTAEQVMAEQVDTQEYRRTRAKRLQEVAAQGGPEGEAAARELRSIQDQVRRQESFVHALREVYRERTGMEWETKSTGLVKSPSVKGDNAELLKAFEGLEAAVNSSTKATKKQTQATEANTQAHRSFDISSMASQAFDAAFNVKLRGLMEGAI